MAVETTRLEAGRVDGSRLRELEGEHPRSVERLSAGMAVVFGSQGFAIVLRLDGFERLVVGGATAVITLGLLAFGLWVRVRRLRGDLVVVRHLDVLALAPVLASLSVLVVSQDAEQLVGLLLCVVVVGAAVRSLVVAGAVVGTVVTGWLVLAALAGVGTGELLKGAGQLFGAAALAGLLQVLRRRGEGRLRAVVLRLDEQTAALAASEAGVRALVDGSPLGIVVVDDGGRLLSVNPAYCHLVGRQVDDLLGRDTSWFTHPDDRAAMSRARAEVETSPGGVGQLEKRYVRPDGAIRWVWVSFRDLSRPGEPRRTIAQVQDVTARKAAEQSLQRSERMISKIAEVVRGVRNGDDARASIATAAVTIAGACTSWILEPADPVPSDLAMVPRIGGVVPSAPAPDAGAWSPLVVSAASGEVHRDAAVVVTAGRSAPACTTSEPLLLREEDGAPPGTPGPGAQSEMRSVLWQPIRQGGRTAGFLVVAWSERVESLSDQRVVAITLLADEAAIAMEQERLVAQLRASATTDPLTGLHNRRAWDDSLAALIAGARRHATPLTVALADLDRFKAYNDTRGHQAGDRLLEAFASACKAVVREPDLLARWGGEEFAFAFPACDAQQATAVLDRLRGLVPDGQTCSIGYATLDPAENADQLLARVDAALYEAKARGRDRLHAAEAPAPAELAST